MRGILELPIYSRIYNDYGHLLEMDEPLLVSGRISFRDDEFGLVADRLELLSQVRSEKALSMTICIDHERMAPEHLRHLRGIFQKYQGPQKVHFRVKTESDASVMIRIPMQVHLNPRMMDELEELWKGQAALFTYAVWIRLVISGLSTGFSDKILRAYPSDKKTQYKWKSLPESQ